MKRQKVKPYTLDELEKIIVVNKESIKLLNYRIKQHRENIEFTKEKIKEIYGS